MPPLINSISRTFDFKSYPIDLILLELTFCRFIFFQSSGRFLFVIFFFQIGHRVICRLTFSVYAKLCRRHNLGEHSEPHTPCYTLLVAFFSFNQSKGCYINSIFFITQSCLFFRKDYPNVYCVLFIRTFIFNYFLNFCKRYQWHTIS